MSDPQQKTVQNPLIAATKAAGNPSDEQLAAINQYTLREYTAEEIYARSFFIAHNAIDRDGEVFDDALLEDFARTLPGKGIFIKHPRSFDGDSGPGPGRWFSARLLRMSLDEARIKLREPGLQFPDGTTEALILEGGAYIPRADHRKALIEDIDAGAASFVSIGFLAADPVPIRDEMDNIIAWRLLAPGEAVETSFVWLGAQPGAAAHKTKSHKRREDDDMSDKELQQKVEDLTKKLNAATEKAAFYDRLESLLGKDALAGEDAPEKLGKAIKDGKDAHAAIVDTIVAHERTLGLVEGDSDKDVAAAKEVYADFPMAKLQAICKRYEQQLPGAAGGAGSSGEAGQGKGQGQLGGGDPNAGGGQGGKDKGGNGFKRDASVTKSAMGQAQAA